MKNPRITTQFNYREQGVEIIPIDPLSETVPDMTLSLADLLAKHTTGRGLDRDLSGLPEDVLFSGHYSDDELDEYFPDMNRLDLVEIAELKDYVVDHVAQTQLKLQKHFDDLNKVTLQGDPKEAAQPLSDPKQPTTAGRQKPAEGGKPQPSEGQQH